jgi:tetratricopeptide (TPR) repeat protein
MGAFEQLLEAWRSNPDADSTVALCTYLSAAPREDLVREVGARSEQWHATDGEVMLAVGRMYLDAGLLAEAQGALVAAGKCNARDSRPFRHLGEVLLGRGDAARAEKVLSRAVQLGATDPETKLWHDRSVVYVALQKRVGTQAVAAEVARTLPKRAAASAPPPAAAPVARPPASPWAEEQPTVRKPAAKPAPGARPALQNARPRSVPPPLPPVPIAQPAFGASPRPPSFSDDDDTTLHDPNARGMFPSGVGTTTQRRAEPRAPAPSASFGRGAAAPALAPPPPPRPIAPPYAPAPSYSPPASAPAPPAPAPPPFAPRAIPRGPLEEPDEVVGFRAADMANPSPQDVLVSLARVGIYEPGGGAPPAWEAALPQRTRGSWVLIVATILVLAVGGGGYAYARKVQHQRADLARRLGDEVETMLHSGEIAQLRASDDKLSKVFELDSRSSRAAKLWLENRVLGALMLPGESHGIDAAVFRARSVEVPEAEVAFGKIASYLAEGDLAGAAANLPRFDKDAGKDAFYQLTAGAVLERAGDLRAIERYEAARALDDKLVIADVLLARDVLLELGPEKAKPVIDELAKKTGETPTTRALHALSWAVDPARPKELPKDAQLSDEDKKALIAPLEPIPAVVEALQLIVGGMDKKAAGAIDSAIQLSDSPAMASQLGFLAIKAGDEKLARKAALRALQFSALYPQARVLASRVALLGGRLDEAKKAIEELDPRLHDVAVVRAVLAYETLDGSELNSALEALGDSLKQPEFVGLAAAPGVALGSTLPPPADLEAMASPSIPWGEPVAMDAALDEGDLELAEKFVKAWGDGAKRPVYALRIARLYRYQEKYDEALTESARALEGTVTVTVVVERVFCLMAKNQTADARDLVAKYQAMLGPMSQWLRMYIDAKSGKAADARAKASQLEPPPDQTPLVLRLVAARALAVTKDKRAKNYVAAMQKRLKKQPDLIKAAEELK